MLLLFGLWAMSGSLWPHGLQHSWLPCPPLSPRFVKFLSIESEMLSNHLIFSCPLLLLPSVFPSVRVFSNGLALHIKYWSFSISPSNEYSDLISFRIDWLDLLASLLWCSAFFMVQISHPYLTTGRTLAYKQYYVITVAYKQYYVINGSTS